MKEKSIKINYLYNMILTCLSLLFPLITAPYVSRILGADNLGKVNFATAFVNWFVIISAFGTATYGLRETAKIKNNRDKLSKLFSELLVIKIITTLIVILIYFVIIFNIEKFYLELDLYLIFSLNIILNIFTIDWFYQAIEDYKYITLRSIIFKIISILAMFIFVKKQENYIIYGAISVFALSFSNILNYIYSKNFVSVKLKNINIKRHFKKLFVFFLSSLVISCYTILDQVVVGFLVSDSAVAFLSRSKQVVSIGQSVTNALSTVLIPKAAFYYENDKKKYKQLIKDSINYIYILALPCTVGIFLLSNEIMLLLGGKTFVQGSSLLSIVALNVFIVSLGTWNYNQIILPTNNENFGVKVQITMAIVSVVSNFILVPQFGYIGAGISLVLAESSGTIIGIIYTHKLQKYKVFTEEFFKYFISTFFMALIIIAVKTINFNYFITIVISLVVSPLVYFIILIILREKNILQLILLIKNKILEKREKL